jgi:hypothetical protein
MDNQVLVRTNASEDDVVKAFKKAFFTPPTLADHFKPTPAAHFRSQMTWRGTDVIGSTTAAKLTAVNLNRTIEDYDNWRHEVGETIALSYDTDAAGDGGAVKIWIDARPMVYGIDRNSPLVLQTYAHEIFGELAKAGFTVQRRGALDDYKVPPGAPPGWPFLK